MRNLLDGPDACALPARRAVILAQTGVRMCRVLAQRLFCGYAWDGASTRVSQTSASSRDAMHISACGCYRIEGRP